MLWCSGLRAGINPVQFIENFLDNVAELGQSLLIFVDVFLWYFTSRSMNGCPLSFIFVPHKYGVLSHHLEVVPIPAKFGFPSVPGRFMRAGEELWRPREVV